MTTTTAPKFTGYSADSREAAAEAYTSLRGMEASPTERVLLEEVQTLRDCLATPLPATANDEARALWAEGGSMRKTVEGALMTAERLTMFVVVGKANASKIAPCDYPAVLSALV